MRLLSDIVESIRQVCRYEKTVRVDTKALQSVMMIFVLVMLLIDIENFKLGKYIIGGVTLAVAVMSIVLVIVLKYIKNVYRICQAAVVVFFILAVIISIEGTNDGFSLLWFLLLPVITLVLLGMPFGAPVCIFLVCILRCYSGLLLIICLYIITQGIIYSIIRFLLGFLSSCSCHGYFL